MSVCDKVKEPKQRNSLLLCLTSSIAMWLCVACVPALRKQPIHSATTQTLRDACEAKDADACAEIAARLHYGQAVKKNTQHSILYARKACKHGSGRGCFLMGDLLYENKPTQSHEQLKKSCDLGYGYACALVAVQSTPLQAIGLLQRSCDLQSATGCALLGVAQINGGDFKAALSSVRKGCHLAMRSQIYSPIQKSSAAGACYQYASFYIEGKWVPPDKEKAQQLLQFACSSGVGKACRAVGLLFLNSSPQTSENITKARDFFRAGCDSYGVFAKSCFYLGNMFNRGLGGTRDQKKALYYYDKACQHNHSSGCTHASVFYIHNLAGVKRDLPRALTYAKKGCEHNSADACAVMGDIYVAQQFPQRAFEAYQHACKLSHANAYMSVGIFYQKGIGREKDISKAVSFFDAACTLRGALGCSLKWASEIELKSVDSLRQCYERALQHKPTLRGEIEVNLRIAPSGQVTVIRFVKDELKHQGLQDCIKQKIIHKKFSPSTEEIDLRISFRFQPEK